MAKKENAHEDFFAKRLPKGQLRFMALGGLGEIGMNMSAIEVAGKILIIDCGQMLPDDSLPGVDVVVADPACLQSRSEDIVGVVITHAHEDHIGGLPYVMPRLANKKGEAPIIYAPKLASEVIRRRFKELKPNPEPAIVEYDHTDDLELGPFTIEPIRVTHSTPNCFAFGIHTPVGTLVWSGDFKIDPGGLGKNIFDFQAFSRLGDEGVYALFIDSTNAAEDGTAGHEIDLIDDIDQVISEAHGTVCFATFSSSLYRIQTVLELAAKHKRKVFVSGRSMLRNMEIGLELGFLKNPKSVVADLRDFDKTAPHKRLILCTGSQGEPLSTLSRLGIGKHRGLQLVNGDLVIMSARMIPGNEKTIYRMINQLTRRGAEVVTSRDAHIHCSGHAKRQELKTLMALCKPQHVIPIHGELRHLNAQRRNARDMGIPRDRIHVIEHGDVLVLDRGEGYVDGHANVGRLLIDGRFPDGVEDVVLRDRRQLADDGMIVIILAVDYDNGDLVQEPEIITRGFVEVDTNKKILDDLRDEAARVFGGLDAIAREDAEHVEHSIRKALRSYIRKRYDRFPMILPLVMEL